MDEKLKKIGKVAAVVLVPTVILILFVICMYFWKKHKKKKSLLELPEAGKQSLLDVPKETIEIGEQPVKAEVPTKAEESKIAIKTDKTP